MSQDQALFAGVVSALELTTGERLSAREREVLFHFVALGEQAAQIARALVISPKTVEAHLGHCCAKLRFRNNREAYRELFRAFARAEAQIKIGL